MSMGKATTLLHPPKYTPHTPISLSIPMRNLIPLIAATALTWLATTLFFIFTRGDDPTDVIEPALTSAIAIYLLFNHINLD